MERLAHEMRKQNTNSFDRLSDAEKEAIFQACEQVRPQDGEPPSAVDKRRHRQAGLPAGRPRIGRGVKRINISMEKDLLSTVDRFARKHKMTRARLIAQSVRAYLSGAA
jgi:hypothetical protein